MTDASSSAAPLRTPHRFIEVADLGAAVSYADGMEAMRTEMEALSKDPAAGAGRLLLLEHQDTVTVTRSGGTEHVRASQEELAQDGITLVETDRGGDVTFHGAGQLVGYPVLRLGPGSGLRVDLLGYLRRLEEALCATVTAFGVPGVHRKEGMTGVWVASDPSAPATAWPDDDNARKIVAIGVGVGRGITRHGFALNVTTDLERFTSRITPCGLVGRPVTSLARERSPLGQEVPCMDDVKAVAAREVARAMGLRLRDASASSAPALVTTGAPHEFSSAAGESANLAMS